MISHEFGLLKLTVRGFKAHHS